MQHIAMQSALAKLERDCYPNQHEVKMVWEAVCDTCRETLGNGDLPELMHDAIQRHAERFRDSDGAIAYYCDTAIIPAYWDMTTNELFPFWA